jgi:hypothetical protein
MLNFYRTHKINRLKIKLAGLVGLINALKNMEREYKNSYYSDQLLEAIQKKCEIEEDISQLGAIK